MSLDNNSHCCPQFYIVCESVYGHYCRGQPDPNNTSTGQQQALSEMSPGPEGHTPSRSDLNRMRETGAPLSFCKGEAKDKSNSLTAQSRPCISSLCLGLELQDYVFCDDEWTLTASIRIILAPGITFVIENNWECSVGFGFFFFPSFSFWMSYFVVKQSLGPPPAGGSTRMGCCHYILSRRPKCFGKTPVMQVHVMLVNLAKVNR